MALPRTVCPSTACVPVLFNSPEIRQGVDVLAQRAKVMYNLRERRSFYLIICVDKKTRFSISVLCLANFVAFQ